MWPTRKPDLVIAPSCNLLSGSLQWQTSQSEHDLVDIYVYNMAIYIYIYIYMPSTAKEPCKSFYLFARPAKQGICRKMETLEGGDKGALLTFDDKPHDLGMIKYVYASKRQRSHTKVSIFARDLRKPGTCRKIETLAGAPHSMF